MQRVKEFCDNLDKYSRGEGVKFQDLVDKAKSLNKKFFQHLILFASREINRSDFGGRFAIKSYIILKITKKAAPEIFRDSLAALTAINSILTTTRNSVIKFEQKYKDKLERLRRGHRVRLPPRSPDIVLIGDSILDNSYWNGVENNNTGQLLIKMGSDEGLKVVDHSTEEITSGRLLRALLQKRTVDVRDHYVKHREEIDYPYPNDGKVPVTPEALNINENSTVFISVGGNDVVLEGVINPVEILGNVKQIVEIYQKAGAKVVYIIPYPPTTEMIENTPGIQVLYSTILKLVKNSGLQYMSLEGFTDAERADPGSGIPEPTVKGAKTLADMIFKYYKDQDDDLNDDLDDAEKYDRFVGKNVILTNWNGTKQKVKIIKNDKQGKKLLVDGGHVLIYTNIGEGRAVTAIEIDKDDSDDDDDDDDDEPISTQKIREWLRNKYGKDWWKVDADEKKKRKKEARAALSKPKSEKPKPRKPKQEKPKPRKPKAEKPKPNKAPRKRKLKPPPSLLDPLRLFYTSLYKENPESSMAIEWLTKHSLYKDGQLVEGIEE